MNISSYRKYYLPFVIAFSLAAAIFLSFRTYYINPWPTDSENPYIPTAAQLFELPYISDMHSVPIFGMLRLTMHGKEALVFGIAIVQRFFNDFETLFPNVFLLITAVFSSSILIFLIFRKLFDEDTGLLGFLLFATTFWSYMYILQGAHQPLALMFFLLAVFLLQKAEATKIFYLFSGAALGFMLFSSPLAPLYLPYYAAYWIYLELFLPREKSSLRAAFSYFLLFAGLFFIFLFFTMPDPYVSLKFYFQFLHMSQKSNNFYLYQDYLSRFFPLPASLRGGGLLWIVRYFLLIMPMMFPVYLLSLGYILKSFSKKHFFPIIALLTLTTPFAVELSRVVQFGRNYYTWYIAIIFLICFAFYHFKQSIFFHFKKPQRRFAIGMGAALLISHVAWNAYIFFGDVLPSRMVTTDVYTWLIRHKTNQAFTYFNHPRYQNLIEFFDNPKYPHKIYLRDISSISDVEDGLIYVPTISGKTIWCECREGDFKRDRELTKLFESVKFKDFVVAKFPTLSSSKIWSEEEEICTYRDLIVKDIAYEDRQKGYVWILDARRLHNEWFSKNP